MPCRPLSARRPVLAFLLTSLAGLAGRSEAQLPFASFSARSAALGGAAVALDDGAASRAVNPAAVMDSRATSALSVGALGFENGDFLDPLRSVSGRSPAALAGGADGSGVTRALRTLADTGNGVFGDGTNAISGGARNIGGFVGQRFWSGVSARPDLVHTAAGTDPSNSWLSNDSKAVFRSLDVQDYGLSVAWPFMSNALSIGVAGHLLRGTAVMREESAFTVDVQDPYGLVRNARTGDERTRTRFTWDAGAIVSLGILRIGGVLTSINEPVFPYAESGAAAGATPTGIRLGRQGRVGVAVKVPGVGLLLAGDLDLTKNDTLVDGLQSREAGGGVEWAIGAIAVRGGISVNLEAPDKAKTLTGGLGVTVGVVRLDAAAIYRTDKRSYGGVVTLRAGI